MKLSEDESILFFVFGCIPTRLLIAYLAGNLSPEYLKYFSFILFVMAIGFIRLYFQNSRLDAFEAGGKTWWAKYRIVHGILYLIAAIYAFNGDNGGYPFLIMDVIFGLILFIQKRLL